MSLIAALLCALAAWRLRHTPLLAVAAATAAINVVASLAVMVARARSGAAPRAAVALRHVSAALGGFFLFVSFSLR